MTSIDSTRLRIKRVDSVTVLMDQWRRERPELGTRVPSIVARILRLASHLRKRAELRQAALGFAWDIAEVVIALRRSGPPFELTPTELYKSMLLTSGAITSRLDRAEAIGLIRRSAAKADRRSIKVRLTPAGKAMADEAVTEYYAEMQMLLDCLRAPDGDRLASLLAELLVGIETIVDNDSEATTIKPDTVPPPKVYRVSSRH